MSDLAEFLLARIDEDEAGARRLLRYAQENELAVGEPQMLGRRIPGWHEWPNVQAMCSGVLAECESKRRIVELHHNILSPPVCAECSYDGDEETRWVDAPCPTLRLLALPYADHPDYCEEWRP